jgi:hypothetical protein
MVGEKEYNEGKRDRAEGEKE